MDPTNDWEDRPAIVSPGSKLELLRCGAGALPPLISINDRHKGRSVHYWRGQSYPHFKKNCPACAAHNIGQWKGFLPVWSPKSRLVYLLEFTHGCLPSFDAYMAAHGTLRGATVQLKRKGTKANGRLSAEVTTSIWGNDQIPPPADTEAALAHLWNLSTLVAELEVFDRERTQHKPPENREQLQRANQAAALGESVSIDEATIPLAIAARLVADRFTIAPHKTNGSEAKP